MYQDQMKPVERAKALAAGKDVDRMPVDIMYGAPAHALMGWTLQQEWESRGAKKALPSITCR